MCRSIVRLLPILLLSVFSVAEQVEIARSADVILSDRLTVGILSLIAIVEIGCLLLDLMALALSIPPPIIGG
jgi:hypothetical protein